MPPLVGKYRLATSCVPYGNSFAIVGGTDGSGDTDTIALYDPETETFPILEERLSERKNYVTAFSVSEKTFPPCK